MTPKQIASSERKASNEETNPSPVRFLDRALGDPDSALLPVRERNPDAESAQPEPADAEMKRKPEDPRALLAIRVAIERLQRDRVQAVACYSIKAAESLRTKNA